jgi:hypothetical protein
MLTVGTDQRRAAVHASSAPTTNPHAHARPHGRHRRQGDDYRGGRGVDPEVMARHAAPGDPGALA